FVSPELPMLLPLLLSPILRPPPRSTLFPYTTLFRSAEVPHLLRLRALRRVLDRGLRARGGQPHRRRGGQGLGEGGQPRARAHPQDRKSTRLNSSHVSISYAVFCLKKKMIIIKETYSL